MFSDSRSNKASPKWLDDHRVAPAFKLSNGTLFTEITQTLFLDECYHFTIDILVSSVIDYQGFGNQNNRQFRQKSPRLSKLPSGGAVHAKEQVLIC